MSKVHILIFQLFLIFVLVNGQIKQCGLEPINNCQECSVNSEYDSCKLCKENHFSLMENLLCIPCNDTLYGQIGCKGNCDASDYSKTSFAFCDECIEGYYNLEGICLTCEDGSPGCKKCTYEPNEETPEGEEKKNFKCQECISSEYKLEDDYCKKCDDLRPIANCQKCHYEGEDQHPVCDACRYDYYVNKEKTCSLRKEKYIPGGNCYIYSDNETDLNAYECYCYSGYVKYDNYSCAQCPDDCLYCNYDKTTNKTFCSNCNSGYALDYSTGKCVKCEEGCQYCYLNQDGDTICTRCTSGKLAPDGSKCLVCPENCNDCDYDANEDKSVCNSCYYNYGFNPSTKECKYCNGLEGTGVGCSTCRYNTSTKGFQCLSCVSNNYNEYAYIVNEFKCASNTDSTVKGLYGCLRAFHDEGSDKYECLECKYDFIFVTTDKSCIQRGSNSLDYICIEAEIIEEKYSCTKCDSSYEPTMVNDEVNGIKNCFKRENEFSFCLEGTIQKDDSKKICSKCVENSQLNDSKICECNSDSFSKNSKWCYKCNDDYQGNPGCDNSQGCSYTITNDELTCKKCIKGYFEFTKGQCFSCSNEITNCNECHYNSTETGLKCDNCLIGIYSVNSENKCAINDCQEYPDISPGCMICKDGLNYYLQNKKCQACKYGYFKTKDEKCVYCKSEKYGGPACYECGYDDSDENIICKSCYLNSLYYSYDYYYDNKYYDSVDDHNLYLSSKGKCFDCQIEFTDTCLECGFLEDENGKEEFQCVRCAPTFYLNNQGKCVSYTSLINRIENCDIYNFTIANMNFSVQSYNLDYYYYDSYNYFKYNYTLTYKDITGAVSSVCGRCYSNYYLTDDGKCKRPTLDECSFLSILQNYEKLYQSCRELCMYDYYYYYDDEGEHYYYPPIIITLPFDSHIINEYGYALNSISIYNKFDKEYLKYFIDQYGENDELKACFNHSKIGESFHNNLKYCRYANYTPKSGDYFCQGCQDGYILNNSTNICEKAKKEDKEKENDFYYNNNNFYCNISINETGILSKYFCRKWDYYYGELVFFTLVTFENNQKKFIEMNGELEGCEEATGDTTYIKTKYDCTKCSYGYALYYSRFFGRYICQNMKMKITRKQEISLEDYEDDIIVPTNNETKLCDKEYLFTPDGENCYRCDAEGIGNPGCKGNCSYSLERNNIIKCEGECKTGYIESSQGVCSPCDMISKGCHECHYENNEENITDDLGIIRKRNFVCDYCQEGYFNSPSGGCLDTKILI